MSHTPILMFGKTGQVAQALTERCAALGLDLVSLGREDADLTDLASLRDTISRHGEGRVVVNAAAYTAVDQAESGEELAHAVNAAAPTAMAQACRAQDLAFIHLSTDYVFDGSKSSPYREADPVSPQSAYGRTKLAGEQGVGATGARAAVIRTSWVYSPFGKNFVKTMLRVGAQRDELTVVADQHGGPTSAHDIADAILAAAPRLLADSSRAGLYHLSGSGEASWADFAEAIFEEAAPHGGPWPVVRRITTSEYPTPAPRPANSVLECSKMEAGFGYRAPHWRESLKTVIARLYEA
jgi:dTDP-4-dehydrorhamnose reductase